MTSFLLLVILARATFGPWKRGWGIVFAYAEGKHREEGQGTEILMQFTAAKHSDLPDGMIAETTIDSLRQYVDFKV